MYEQREAEALIVSNVKRLGSGRLQVGGRWCWGGWFRAGMRGVGHWDELPYLEAIKRLMLTEYIQMSLIFLQTLIECIPIILNQELRDKVWSTHSEFWRDYSWERSVFLSLMFVWFTFRYILLYSASKVVFGSTVHYRLHSFIIIESWDRWEIGSIYTVN